MSDRVSRMVVVQREGVGLKIYTLGGMAGVCRCRVLNYIPYVYSI